MKMKIEKSLTFFIFVLFTRLLFAQEPLDFFPHQVGDRWEYQHFNGNSFIEILNLTRDSVDTGNHFIFFNHNLIPDFKLDSISNRVYKFSSNDLIYQLDGQQGDAWDTGQGGGEKWAWIDTVYATNIFGKSSVVKVIKYGPAHPDTFGTEYYLRERKIASGFGLIYEWEEGPYITYLRGCIIDSDTFGTIISVPHFTSNIRDEFILHQNYPNPFNPNTTIEYQLNRNTPVVLEVFNNIGQKVEALVNEVQPPGNYHINFDGSNLSSGIYYYRIKAGEFRQQRKMLLIK
jgi:hypothetical protein